MKACAGKVKHQGVMIPNLVPYSSRLSKAIKEIDIGELKDLNPTLTTDCNTPEVVGRYRNLCTYLPRLALER